MNVIVKNVTIFLGTSKRLAKRYAIEEVNATGDSGRACVHFMEKAARTRWWTAKGRNIVIVDGWDHPEFDFLIRAFQDAPVKELSAGVTYKTVEKTVAIRGGSPPKDKYELEFEAYLHSLDPRTILLDTRPSDV